MCDHPTKLTLRLDQFSGGRSVPGKGVICVMDDHGSGQVGITDGAHADGPPAAWSADGTKIAFSSDHDGDVEIYMMNPDGSGARRLTNSPGVDGAPSWTYGYARCPIEAYCYARSYLGRGLQGPGVSRRLRGLKRTFGMIPESDSPAPGAGATVASSPPTRIHVAGSRSIVCVEITTTTVFIRGVGSDASLVPRV